MTERHRFVVMGSGGMFTYHVVHTLLEEGCEPVAYIQSGSASPKNNRIAGIEIDYSNLHGKLMTGLQDRSIPCYYQHDLAKRLRQAAAQFILVACWPQLISQQVIQSVSKAALNLHPSLLPRFRGINPIADQLNSNDRRFGVSLHLLSGEYDKGDVVLQQPLNDGYTLDRLSIERKAAITGAKLFIRAMQSYKTPGWSLKKQGR